jgi:DNA polymerase epsilon subunit 2
MKGSMIRKKVERKCKIRGYILKVEALEEILSFVERFPGAEDDAVDLLLDQLDLDSRNFSLLSPFSSPCSASYTLRF